MERRDYLAVAGADHWLKVHLQGDGKTVNRSAIGAQVRIKLGDKTLTRQVEAGTGEGNQNEMTLHFGLGDHHGPVDLEVFWPSNAKQTLSGVRTNRLSENFVALINQPFGSSLHVKEMKRRFHRWRRIN